MKRGPVFVTFVFFLILSFLTFIGSIIRYKGVYSLNLALLSIVFNVSFCILAILVVNSRRMLSGRKYLLLIFYLALCVLFYWYIYNALFYIVYGEFASVVALLFFFSTRTFFVAMLIIWFFILLVVLTTFFLFRLSDSPSYRPKPIEKKILIFAILLSIVLLIFSSAMVPHDNLSDSSPLIKFIRSWFFDLPVVDFNQTEVDAGEEIFNYSFEDMNVVVVMLEAVSAEHVGFYGYNRTVTPNIDRLALQSIVFDKAYSFASHSEYSQPTFLSSRYALINSYRNFFNVDYPRKFVWDGFKERDYNTAYISSQDDRWANMIGYYNTSNLDVYSYSMSDGEYDYGGGNAQKDFDERTSDLALDWLQNNSDSNFFLYLDFQATHYPYSYPENNSFYLPDEPSVFSTHLFYYDDDYVPLLNRYDNSLLYVDKQVGKVLDYLETNNLMNNTIVILTSDHGETIAYSHGHAKHGFGVYEIETRVPLLMYLPSINHSVIEEKVRHIDVVPTLYDFLGFENYEEFQGHSMKTNQDIYLVLGSHDLYVGLVRDDLKVVVHINELVNEAYNLTADPLELDNLYFRGDTNFSLLRDYEYDVWSWYYCQLDYYNNERYLLGEEIECK